MSITCPLCRAEIPPSPDEIFFAAERCHQQRHDQTQKTKAAELLVRVLEEQNGYGNAWVLLITAGGGVVAGKSFTPAELLMKVLDMWKVDKKARIKTATSYMRNKEDKKATKVMHGKAWLHFGLQGGGDCDMGKFSPKGCFIQALEIWPELAVAWLNLGATSRPLVIV